jgi:predicted enzyme related to lactoylglutathione lyase
MIGMLVNIDVDDLARGIDFYRRAFGFTLRRTLFAGTVAELDGGPCRVYLIAKPAGSPAGATIAARRDYAGHWTPIHLEVAVDDIEAAVTRAVDAGAVREGETTSADWGRLAVLRDPFGHGFCLIVFSAAGYDAVADPSGSGRP